MYILFAGDTFYPSGGMKDYKGQYDTVQDALFAAKRGATKYDWYQIVDKELLCIVEEGSK